MRMINNWIIDALAITNYDRREFTLCMCLAGNDGIIKMRPATKCAINDQQSV